jgi:hypothetical protein
MFAGTASGGRTLIDAMLLASISCLTLALRLDSFNHCSESLDLSATVFGYADDANKGRKCQGCAAGAMGLRFGRLAFQALQAAYGGTTKGRVCRKNCSVGFCDETTQRAASGVK